MASDTSSDLEKSYCQVLEGAGLRPIDAISHDCSDRRKDEEDLLQHLNATWNGDTVLHTAAIDGHLSLIPILMRYGADPTVQNEHGHTPYVLSKNKDVRDMFRRFMARYPSAWDYESAHIPSPLTEEMEAERNKKDAERKKEKKKKWAKKQREKAGKEKEEKEEKVAELGQLEVSESLSKREKQAMAAERRMATLLPTSSAILS